MSLYETIPDYLREFVRKPITESHLDGRGYKMKITGELEHSHGIMWVGELYMVGKLFAIVENAGRGGCNDYTIKNDDLWDTFCEDAYTAYGNSSESKDELVQFIDLISNGGEA